MRIRLWQGFHSEEIRNLIREAWSSEGTLLILCPPEVDGSRIQIDFSRTKFPEPPVLGLFTSGTQSEAGARKLVLYSRKNIRSSLNAILEHLEPARIDSIFCYPQPFHTFGLLLGYILSLEKGWPLFTGEGRYSHLFHERWLDLVDGKNGRGMLTLGTPTHFQDLIAHAMRSKRQPGPSGSCVVGGAKVSASLWKRLRDELKIEKPSIGYGATEASPGIAHLPAGREPSMDGEIGFILKGVDLRVKEDGGFVFRGPNLCMATATIGDEETVAEFPKEMHISDELILREDGVWLYRGRGDRSLNRGGAKFSLSAIEELLVTRLGTEVMALAVPHERLGQELGLLLAGKKIENDVVLELLRERFHVDFDPAYFRLVSALPLNENLKPDREKALKMIQGSRSSCTIKNQ